MVKRRKRAQKEHALPSPPRLHLIHFSSPTIYHLHVRSIATMLNDHSLAVLFTKIPLLKRQIPKYTLVNLNRTLRYTILQKIQP